MPDHAVGHAPAYIALALDALFALQAVEVKSGGVAGQVPGGAVALAAHGGQELVLVVDGVGGVDPGEAAQFLGVFERNIFPGIRVLRVHGAGLQEAYAFAFVLGAPQANVFDHVAVGAVHAAEGNGPGFIAADIPLAQQLVAGGEGVAAASIDQPGFAALGVGADHVGKPGAGGLVALLVKKTNEIRRHHGAFAEGVSGRWCR